MALLEHLEFTVYGIPRPKGSKRAFVLPATTERKARAVLVEDSAKDLRPWLSSITYAAQQGKPPSCPWEGPIAIHMEFAMPKPKSYPKTRYRPMVTRPDLDKLARAVKDALINVIYHDDGQVVSSHMTKTYGDRPGVHIAVHPFRPDLTYDWSRRDVDAEFHTR